MKKAWYILNYHNISWEENIFMRPVGGTFSPDLFEDHVLALKKRFRIVGIEEGYQAFREGKIHEPLLSFWFDDGLIGCRKYAAPILDTLGYSAAISINSAFTLRKEIYWRLELAWLSANGFLPTLRKELTAAGYKIPSGMSIREYTLGDFDPKLRKIIQSCFSTFAGNQLEAIAYSVFDSVEGLQYLQSKGWILANHSASHFPVSEKKSLPLFFEEFERCDADLAAVFGAGSPFWVMPFDRKPDPGLHAMFESSKYAETTTLVHVGNKLNTKGMNPRYLYRFFVPDIRGKDLVRHLSAF